MRQTKQTEQETGVSRQPELLKKLVLEKTSGAGFFRYRPEKEDLS
jgi:hypothetical protein